MKYYAGIGSRETPDDVLDYMYNIAQGLFYQGYILRSGSAPGADLAFEQGLADARASTKQIQKKAEIFLPWPRFQEKDRTWIKPCLAEPSIEAFNIAKEYHPRWKYLKHGARYLIARNTHQIYGPFIEDPTFVDFVICWTKGAKGGGGTGQAIRIAKSLDISVYDLADENQQKGLWVHLNDSFII